jgi:hypothetical protein
MKNTKKMRFASAIRSIAIIALIAVTGFSLISCNLFSKGGQAFFLSETAAGSRSARNTGGSDTIEFLVTRLMLKDDTAGGGVWIVGSGAHTGDHAGFSAWFDIEGLQQADFYNQPGNKPHSCVYLSIRAIRINDNLYSFNQQNNSPEMISFAGNKGDIPIGIHEGPAFDIIAGDLNKLGPGEHGGGVVPMNIPFQGVSGIRNIEEFIIIVDESKLHNNGILAPEWWKSFSFSE